MDRQDDFDIVGEFKQPYVKFGIIITIIVIGIMYLSQPLWMNTGITTLYKEYKAEDVLPNNSVPDGIFILSGNYSYISEYINTSKLNCDSKDNVKLLVYSSPEKGMKYFKDITVMPETTISGCKLN